MKFRSFRGDIGRTYLQTSGRNDIFQPCQVCTVVTVTNDNVASNLFQRCQCRYVSDFFCLFRIRADNQVPFDNGCFGCGNRTQFMLNRSVSAVFIPICLLTCSALGANPTGLVLLVNAASLTAFLTPMATPAVPMCMADGGYDLKSLFKSGALITLILPFIYIFYTMTVFPAF